MVFLTREDVVKLFENSISVAKSGGIGVLDEGTILSLNALEISIEALKQDIVRCGECKMSRKSHIEDKVNCMRFGSCDVDCEMSIDDFCSYGDRRTE